MPLSHITSKDHPHPIPPQTLHQLGEKEVERFVKDKDSWIPLTLCEELDHLDRRTREVCEDEDI
jgi:hypothetical protein